jgi:hypothetical protein
MKRSLQVWKMVGALGQPLTTRFPAKKFASLVAEVQKDPKGDLRAFSEDGTELLLEAVASARPHVCLHRIRRNNLPSEETAGRVQDLSIPAGSGLAEGTHLFFYPRNVVLVLYNHEGPRAGRMSDWLRQRTGIDVLFKPVHRVDIAAIINSMVRFNAVELSLDAQQAAHLLQDDLPDDDVAQALFAASRLTGLGNIRLGLSVGAGMPSEQKQSAFRGLVDRILGREDLPGFRVARVTGVLPDGGTTVVDLIEDRLVAQQEVEAEDSRFRRVSNVSAVEAAEATFDLFRQQISQAVPPIEGGLMDLPEALSPVPD